MRAKSINESSNLLRPKSIEQILKDLELSGASMNDILIAGVENDQPKLIEYAITNNADQLWFETGGPHGGSRTLFMHDSESFVRIVGVKYYNSKYQIVFTPVAFLQTSLQKIPPNHSMVECDEYLQIETSDKFSLKYTPITDHEIQLAKFKLEEIQQRLDIINKLSKQ